MSVDTENPDLLQAVKPENEMKRWLVNYVGDKLNPENDEVNVEMIIQVMAEEFPEFLILLVEGTLSVDTDKDWLILTPTVKDYIMESLSNLKNIKVLIFMVSRSFLRNHSKRY